MKVSDRVQQLLLQTQKLLRDVLDSVRSDTQTPPPLLQTRYFGRPSLTETSRCGRGRKSKLMQPIDNMWDQQDL